MLQLYSTMKELRMFLSERLLQFLLRTKQTLLLSKIILILQNLHLLKASPQLQLNLSHNNLLKQLYHPKVPQRELVVKDNSLVL